MIYKQRTEVGGQKTELRIADWEIRSEESGDRSQNPGGKRKD